MSDIIKSSENIYRLLPNRYKEDGESTWTYVNQSRPLTRQSYGSHTFYVTNPNGTQVTIQCSPGDGLWFDLAPASVETSFILHSTLNCSLVRILTNRAEDAADDELVVLVSSGGLAHL